ncbi:MAG: preprotein translocase subunit YajC [Clostridia bacterium]|nr:preprotein translocase subunit YajC [Clostridia bacterium]
MILLASEGLFSCSGGSSSGLMSFLPLILIFGVMIVVMIVPQRRKDKAVKNMLASLKPGDRVRTIGGIYGTISSIRDDVVILIVGPEKTKIPFVKGAIAQIEDQGIEQTMSDEVK